MTTMTTPNGDSRSPRRPSSRTVRWRLLTLCIVVSVLLVGMSGVGLAAVYLQQRQVDRAIDVVEPAVDANRQVRLTLVQAQSALRGYVLSQQGVIAGRPGAGPAWATYAEHLQQTYRTQDARVDGELSVLTDRLTAPDVTADEDRRRQLDAARTEQEEAVARWRDLAREVSAQPETGEQRLDEGRRLFGAVGRANDAVAEALDGERAALQASMSTAVRDSVLAVLAATALALGAVLLIGRRTGDALTTPLRRLRDIVRRQRDGDRTAWAATDSGAVEVRELAGDVNALTAAHHELTDRQESSLRVLRAQAVLGRAVQSSRDVPTALQRAAEGIGRALRADLVVCGVFSEQRRLREPAVWSAPDTAPPAPLDAPTEPAQAEPPDGGDEDDGTALADYADGLWGGAGDRFVAADDVAALPPGSAECRWAAKYGPAGTGSLLAVPLGLGDRAIGVALVRGAARRWNSVETAFVQHIVGEITRFVMLAAAERQQAEHVTRLEELDRQKDAFMATVSHELRTPLTSISGYVEMLSDDAGGGLSDPQQQMIEVIGRNTDRLRDLIENLIVLNELDVTDLPPHAPLVCLGEVVREVADALAAGAEQAGITVSSEQGTDLWTRGDRAQLTRALANLASNAVKFSPRGGRITLSARPSADGARVELGCADTGMGIPADETEHLFTRFFRASNATRAQIQGSGLGLVIVRGIVERHGGTLTVDSVEGAGTTVTMSVPRAASPDPAEAVEPAPRVTATTAEP